MNKDNMNRIKINHEQLQRKKMTGKYLCSTGCNPMCHSDDLNKIKCPSLIVCGDNDLIPIEHTAAIYRHIPHAYLWVLPHSGHATLKEHRDEFNRMADSFFKEPFDTFGRSAGNSQ